jgi:hypothetical protein
MSIVEKLREMFDPSEVKWKSQVIRANRALAVAYVDARVVEDRLDDVFGVEGWQDEYHCLPNGSVVCKLRVRIDGEWIEKSDVGSQSDQPDEGDRVKSAFSDALKRAAVKLGIGRYLYRLPQQWVDYDPNTKQLRAKPTLPTWAIPQEKPDSKPEMADGKLREAALALLKPAAEKGREEFSRAWKGLTKLQREACDRDVDELTKRAEAMTDLVFKEWTRWVVEDDPNLEAINNRLAELKRLSEPDRKKVWPMLKAHCEKHDHEFDEKAKVFRKKVTA